jgi:hypothetical protein
MNGYWRSTSGRLMTLGIGLMLAAAGIAALLGGVAGLPVAGLGLPLGIVCGIVAVAFGVEDHLHETVLAVIVGPVALFLFEVFQSQYAPNNPTLAYAMLALGAGAIARAAFIASPSKVPAERVAHTEQRA